MFYIIAAIYGVLMGNYMSAAYFRISNMSPINGLNFKGGKRPYCDDCLHPLRFYEYLPLLSWIFSQFRCNYCGVSIDRAYLALEVGCMVIAVIFFLLFGMNVFYVKVSLISFILLLNICLFINYGKLYKKALLILLFSGVGVMFL